MRRSSRTRRFLLPSLLLLSACLRNPLAAAEGFPPPPQKDLPAPEGAHARTAVLAMGCFWCAEGVFERIEGVTDVKSGFAGGNADTAEYEKVSAGGTNHAESIRITYDPSRISYGTLLQIFFATHDPTTRDRQGPDYGHQYRSAIFYASPEERAVAEAYIRQLNQAHVYANPIVTTLEPLDAFYPAEAYHQDYIRNHPNDFYVRMWFPAKERKLKAHFGALLKKEYRD